MSPDTTLPELAERVAEVGLYDALRDYCPETGAMRMQQTADKAILAAAVAEYERGRRDGGERIAALEAELAAEQEKHRLKDHMAINMATHIDDLLRMPPGTAWGAALKDAHAALDEPKPTEGSQHA